MSDDFSERDAYQRAYNICRDALLAIHTDGNRSLEQYLADQGFSPQVIESWRLKSEWELLRRMDYEAAEIALNRALDVLRLLRGE